jgi:hypothetical protein
MQEVEGFRVEVVYLGLVAGSGEGGIALAFWVIRLGARPRSCRAAT